jgi:hypothetical protein
MLALVVLFPIIFVSTVASLFAAMLVAISTVFIIAVGLFIGALTACSTAFLAFLMVLFS